ncbi:glucose-6-phosphate isomerase [Desulfogranum marinum]|uniref:glucose-6-phosphate isomerase n=1 Tax=Desulfogranum marinum TaxID=453220 RepID=UPI0029C82CE4|nr:glucose-6-phosphate isomerase [Desulfogranum marinum]
MEYQDFNQLPAVATLSALAADPHDLSGPHGLTVERLQKYRASANGFDFLYAGQRVEHKVLDALQELADQAGLVDQFLAMKSGAVMNAIKGYESENRQVLHTACRDIFTTSRYAEKASKEAEQELFKLKQFLEAVRTGEIANAKGEKFTTMIQVGIGGSDLGPRAVYLALKPYRVPGRDAEFIANVDPDDSAEILGGVDLSRTLINVVSKSGTTLETLTNEKLVRQALRTAGLDPALHVLSVTGKGSPMDDPDNYLASFYMYDYVGGRYSATSMVGGVTLGFVLGYEGFVDILRGANEVDIAAEQRDIRNNIPLLMAMLGIWNRNFLGYPTVAVLAYSQALVRFAAHLQQCDMESNGKSVTRTGADVQWKTGPVIWGEPGTNGQHAFYQLLHQGTEIVPVEFIGFRTCQYGKDITVAGTTSQQKLVANMLAQSLAMATGRGNENPAKRFSGNRPGSILLADRLNPETMGRLLAMYETKIAFQGFCWNINSFDQEGVQLGKVLAEKLLAQMALQDSDDKANNEEKTVEYTLLKIAGMV